MPAVRRVRPYFLEGKIRKSSAGGLQPIRRVRPHFPEGKIRKSTEGGLLPVRWRGYPSPFGEMGVHPPHRL